MLSADFVFTVIFIILVPLAVICSACVVADTVLAYIKHHEERCWNCIHWQKDTEPEEEKPELPEWDDEKLGFVQPETEENEND